MHTKFSLVILLLSLSNYQLLNSPSSIEARNLASHGQTFTIDLIHRNSQPFSRCNSSTTTNEKPKGSILGSISYSHHFHLSSKHYGHSSRTIGTKMIPRGGEYLMKFAIGTPPIELTAVADTGSDLMWVQCSPCQNCIPHEPRFNPNRSSSYKVMPCNSKSCNFPYFESTCIPDNDYNYGLCVYNAGYADGTSSSGVLASDKVTFTPAHDHSVTFGCGFNQQGNFGDTGAGVIGLGSGNLSLVSQLGYNKFTYCLTPPSSGLNAKLKLGPNKISSGSVSTPMVNLGIGGFYILQLKAIRIGKRSIKVDEYIVIDSGTTYTYLESSVYDSLKNATKNAIELEPVPDPTQTFEPCYKAEETMEGFNLPDIVFHFNGAKVVLKSINTFETMDNVTCLAILPIEGNFILGNIAQVNFEIEYDLDAKKISFAPTDCTKY